MIIWVSESDFITEIFDIFNMNIFRNEENIVLKELVRKRTQLQPLPSNIKRFDICRYNKRFDILTYMYMAQAIIHPIKL